MIIVYTPEGGEPERLNAGRLRTSEIQIAERTADRPWDQLKQGLKNGDATSVRTVAWVIKKRQEPALRFGQFDPYEDELAVKLDDREVRRYAEIFMNEYGDKPDDLAGAWEELRDAADNPDIAEAAIAEQVDGPKEASPSAGSVTSETNTSASSPTTSATPPTTSTT
ncbi:hypothetical protein ACTU45_23070 [Streptomyces sp. 24-1644]|uniref:hypothetical protein n=1 Tax=Streptomyces sp. 24-1644 TaxID=3457315 RepID=UPI003FA6978E